MRSCSSVAVRHRRTILEERRQRAASIVEIDKASGEVRVCRWYPIGRRQKTYPVSALTWAEVEITEHSEGGPVYRPRLCLGKAEFVPVSMFWYQTKEHSEAVVREIQGFLHLSPTS
jgi:hypothetical protein